METRYNWKLSLWLILLLVQMHRGHSQGRQRHTSAVSCTEQQTNVCRRTAQAGKLEKLGAGGQCETQQYVHYTHTCTLNVYLPDVDYCCCTLNTTILCCRYNQNLHDLFRCQLEQDFIGTTDDVDDTNSEDSSIYYLLPVILVPVLGCMGCVLALVIFCRKRNQFNLCKNKTKSRDPESTQNAHAQEMQSLTRTANGDVLPQTETAGENKRPIEEILAANRIPPSAPHFEDTGNGEGTVNSPHPQSHPLLPQYSSQGECPDESHRHNDITDTRGSQCPNCSAQPPTYHESLHHPVLDQQISHVSNRS